MPYFRTKTVWITGASSGIGEALVKALAKKGANLILSSRKEEDLRRVQKEAGLSDSVCLILPLDLANPDSMQEVTQKAIAKFGKVDILINNGGVSQRSFAMNTSLKVERQIMEVNFFGTVALTKSLIPYMIEQHGGQLVVISSISGKFGFYLRSAYSASKHALHGYFDSLRLELRPNNIRVLLVCPGKIVTNISINAMTGSGESNNKMDAAQARGMSAEKCAAIILEGIKNKKNEINVGNRKERLAVWLRRIYPSLFSKVIAKQKVE
jgi:short-subunit dehydrogenase